MALERDHSAERLARIDVLLTEAKRTMAQHPSVDRDACESISNHLDELSRLRGPSVVSSGTHLTARRVLTNAHGTLRRA